MNITIRIEILNIVISFLIVVAWCNKLEENIKDFKKEDTPENKELERRLDEFQNLSSFNDYLFFEKKLRACWQRHKSVTYCLYGSKRHMMTDIFNNPSKPFYRFGDIMLLQKIETKKWVSFICKSFAATDKQIDEKTDLKISSNSLCNSELQFQ